MHAKVVEMGSFRKMKHAMMEVKEVAILNVLAFQQLSNPVLQHLGKFRFVHRYVGIQKFTDQNVMMEGPGIVYQIVLVT